MSARKKKNQINLLPQEEFAASTLGRILAWLLSTFRIIVIVTEMIVMIAFLSRFWLDAQSSDLNDLIKQKRAIITSSSDVEKEFRDVQKKLEIFSALAKEETTTNYFQQASSLLPSEIFLNSISLVGQEIRLEGASTSERAIAQYIANLESQDAFTKVSISQVDTNNENRAFLNFALKVSLKGKVEK